MKLGAQFFTIRDFCKTTEDLAQSLKKVADIGYTTVQLSGTCEYDAVWMRQQLDSLGLSCVLTHTPPKKLTGETEQVCENHRILGCSNIGLGSFNFKEGETDVLYSDFLNTYLPVAKTLCQNGMYFMYHNHDFELRHLGGTTILRQMAQDFAPDEMGFTLDTYWIQRGGASPVEYIKELSGRVPCIHLKDYAYGQLMAVVGEGNINFDAVIAAAESAGTQYLLVEQDNCNGEDPFECLKRSYQNLRAMGLE